MKYVDGKSVLVGYRADFGGGMTGAVMAVIDEGEFSSGYPEDEWSYLSVGALVKSSEGWLVHYPKSDPDFALLERAAGHCA